MDNGSHRWAQLYNQVPLCDVARHFAGIKHSPFMTRYLQTVLRHCPRGGRSLETGFGSGHSAIWLSLRGIAAHGYDLSPELVERARQVNALLGGTATFAVGDLFQSPQIDSKASEPRTNVIHHQGVLEHFTVPHIQAALARQVAAAQHVVFSVPSVFYPYEPEFGDERLLPLEEWQRILEPFDVVELKYYGDPQHGEKEHILAVLRGQPVTPALQAMLQVPNEPYPPGVSAIVHTRNEARHIADCLQTLSGWTDEIIVCDMESDDDTVEIARSFTPHIVSHPHIAHFDRARNVSAMRARYRWVFYLDADERVPPGLGPALRALIDNPDRGPEFDALLIPFRHHFAGQWLRSLYPGYTMPRLFKNGRFHFNARLHAGAQVAGRTVCFPADNPDLALVHYSYDSLSHYLEKLNRYTDGEAASLQRDGQAFHWQNAVGHFVRDFASYYDHGHAAQDGVHGFLYSFLSAFYRFEQHAKLYERRYRQGQLQPAETAVPASVEEVLEYALSVLREKPLPSANSIRVIDDPTASDNNTAISGEKAAKKFEEDAAALVWSGPLFDPSGYGEESRHFVLGLDEVAIETGLFITAHALLWSHDEVELDPNARSRLQALTEKPAAPGFVHVIENFPTAFERHPQAGLAIGRTMFETDRLPPDWVQACNRMDYIWVPSEFNRQTFAAAGVAPEKLVVIPGCFDPTPFLVEEGKLANRETEQVGSNEKLASGNPSPDKSFTFLSVFDWTRHKGWDVLLRAFLENFEKRNDVALVLKVWSTMGYSAQAVREQAAYYIREILDHDLLADSRVRFVQSRLSSGELRALYRTADAFVLPSRGEGWGRPLMEAMATGLPTIGTNWSGNTAFMTGENSFLIDCAIEAVPEIGWRELPTYKGHRWAEPSREHLKQLMQRVIEDPEETAIIARRGREHVITHYDRKTVARQIAREIENARQEYSRLNARDAPPVIAESKTMAVRWEGAQFSRHSLGHVNRELCLGLLASRQVELSLAPIEPSHSSPNEDPRFNALQERFFAPLSKPAQIHVRHFFPPRFEPPPEGHLVLIQPWEYGYLPADWIAPIQNHVAEVWCYSEYVRRVYEDSGIPAEKLHVVPLGVDTAVFHPAALPHVFTNEAGASHLARERGREYSAPERGCFTFLFAGGTLHRKGIDILLAAYRQAFTTLDDVCLVVKDTGTQTVYRGQNERERILELAGDENLPPIIYLDDDLSAPQMAGLYAAADCLVQPYRGEGFCLPALEAMACGVPAIVPDGGPTDDFVDEAVGWRIAAEKKPRADQRIGEWDCAGPIWMFEVDPGDLARLMREIYGNREEATRRGGAAAQRASEHWGWVKASQAVLERLQALGAVSAPSKQRAVESEIAFFSAAKKAEQTAVAAPTTEIPTDAIGTDSVVKVVPRTDSPSDAAQVASSPPRSIPTISLCLIARDEERVLGACLQSIRPHVDEMIVVDTGSIDRTAEIAEEYGAKLFRFPWCDDFSAARNESLRHATGDWIFWMDADDTIPAECGAKLRELAELAEERTTGFLMQVHIPPAPGEDGFTIVDHVKLFRNLPELRFEGRIHEQILEPIHRSGGCVQRSDLHVVHSGYDYSPAGQQKKRERDLLLLQKDLDERPGHPFVLFNIGMTAHHLKEWDKAIEALQQCLQKTKPRESIVRKAHAMLAGSFLAKGEVAQAVRQIEAGLALFPHDPELLFRAGIVYREAGDLPSAERSYIMLLTQREVGHIDSLDVSMTGFKAHHNLALIYRDMSRLPEAEAQFRAALADNPQFVPSQQGLGEVLQRLGHVTNP